MLFLFLPPPDLTPGLIHIYVFFGFETFAERRVSLQFFKFFLLDSAVNQLDLPNFGNLEDLRVCLEAGFDSEKCQFFDETRRLFEEHTLRYGRKKQRWIIKKVAFAAQSLASKHTLSEDALYFHAQFRKTKTRTGQPVTILETTGRGHYVGTLLSMQPERGKHLGYRSAELTPKPRRR